MNDKEIKRFVQDRNDAVFSFSVTEFKKYIKKYFPDKISELEAHDAKWIRGCMAKMAMQITDAPAVVMVQAIKILNSLGWGPMLGVDLKGMDDEP